MLMLLLYIAKIKMESFQKIRMKCDSRGISNWLVSTRVVLSADVADGGGRRMTLP